MFFHISFPHKYPKFMYISKRELLGLVNLNNQTKNSCCLSLDDFALCLTYALLIYVHILEFFSMVFCHFSRYEAFKIQLSFYGLR